mmetsp:Transcript_25237/g.70594  ORF Transcript_25237/g.70594 Transcript_25237/m.70594 type:complete len:1463 (-) Transcript_25237:203-4591(-)
MSMLQTRAAVHPPMGWETPPGNSPLPPSPSPRPRGALSSTDSHRMDQQQPSICQVGGMVPLVKLLGAAYEDSVIALSASAIAGLAINTTNAQAFREAGGVPILVWLLKERLCHDVTSAALWAATSLARHSANSDAIREAGGIPPLLALLHEDAGRDALAGGSNAVTALQQEELIVQAAAALGEMAASSEASQGAIVAAGGLQSLEGLLRSGLGRVGGVSLAAVAGLRAITKLLGRPQSLGAQKCSEKMQGGHVDLLLGLLEAGLAGAPEVAEEAAAALEAMTAAAPVLCGLVCATRGAVAALAGIVADGPYAPGVVSAARALGNVAEQLGEQGRAALAAEDAVALLELLADPPGLGSEDAAAAYHATEASLAAATALEKIQGARKGQLGAGSGGRGGTREASASPSVPPESIPALVSLLRENGTADFAVVHAAGALADLAMRDDAEHRQKIFDAGGAQAAVEKLKAAAASTRDGSRRTSRDSHHHPVSSPQRPSAALHNVLRLVAGLAKGRAIAASLQEAGMVSPLVLLLGGPWGVNSGSISQVAAGCVEALRWLCENNRAAHDEVREQGCIPLLTVLLTMASTSGWHHVGGAEERTVANTAAALRFLAVNARNRDAIREAAALPLLVELLSLEPGSNATVQAAAALTNLSRKKRSNMIAIAEAGGVPPLVRLLWQGPTSEAAVFSLSALTNLAYTSANRDIIRESGGIPAMVHLMETCCSSVASHGPLLSQVVAVLGNLAGTSRNREAIREAKALPLMVRLVSSPASPPEIVGLSVSALTLLALSHANAEAICREGVVPPLVGFLSNELQSQDLAFKAAEAIRVLSSAPNNRAALCEAGVLQALVTLLGPAGQPLQAPSEPPAAPAPQPEHNSSNGSSSSDLLVEVILAIRNLVTSARNQDLVRELGGVSRLVEILRDPQATPRMQLHGVSALINLFAHNSTNREVVRVAGGIGTFVQLLSQAVNSSEGEQDSNSELTAQAALALGFLARSDVNREAIRTAGGIPLLVTLLQCGPEAEVTLCAVDALRHVVATPANAKALLMAGGVAPLLHLLQAGPDHEVTHQSLWVLKVLARSMAAAEAIRALGGLPVLVRLLDGPPASEATIQAAAVIRDMADVDSDEGLAAIREAGAVPCLIRLLKSSHEGGQAMGPAMAAVALANLAQSNENRDAIQRSGGIPPLVSLLSFQGSDGQVAVKAAAALLNISISDSCMLRMVESRIVPVLVGLLSAGPDKPITTWAAAVLASLARSEYGRQAIDSAGGIPSVVELLALGAKSGPARQAAAAVQELACGSYTREALTNYGAVQALLAMHESAGEDEELAECCVQALKNLSRCRAARQELQNSNALDLLMISTLPAASPSSSSAECHYQVPTYDSAVDYSSDGLHHAPRGGWSWQQVGRQRDYRVHRSSLAVDASGSGWLGGSSVQSSPRVPLTALNGNHGPSLVPTSPSVASTATNSPR